MNDLKASITKLLDTAKRYRRYLPVLFCILLALVYGFVTYRIQVLNQAEPDANAATIQAKTSQVPQIDPEVVSQLQNLQDNSVSVKSLFDEARSNPFQEQGQ